MKNKKIILTVLISFGILGLISVKFFQAEDSLPSPFSSPYIKEGRVGVESKKVTAIKLPKLTSQPLPSENTEKITIIIGTEKTNLSVPPDISFYEALVQAKKMEVIKFSGKNYPGLGFFVTEIGTLRAGDGKYLLYYINGKEASVGVSAYQLKDGDVIEWKLE